ncbi:hypothetical protein G6F66_011180 [Rhizopus arrhizus]|nr:hypothetical protein G6F23_008773 [Rhizopus arrhizus]KAG1282315.1 hypothetical protein G6F66_011180 [Rhizopus arrhizus]
MQLYNTLINILEQNSINELGLLYFPLTQNDLPEESRKYYPFVVVESNLGIPTAILANIIKETHEFYVTLSKNDFKEMEQVTRVMILLKPDNYTAMNRRKELMLSGHINPVDELQLLNLIFTIPKHSKSSVAWYHRQWIVTEYSSIDIDAEMRLCEMTCSTYKRNYYSWQYRCWILVRNQQDSARVKKEYAYIICWIERNVSDYSGFQYLEQVMKIIQWETPQIESHMEWLNNLTVKFPGHESIWCHRRYCSYLFSEFNTKNYCILQHQFVQDTIQNKYKKRALSDNEDDIILQKQFALKFGLWLTFLEKRRCHNSYSSLVNPSLINSYISIAPDSKFLDRQG